MSQDLPDETAEALDQDEGTIRFTVELDDLLGTESEAIILREESKSGNKVVQLSYGSKEIILDFLEVRSGKRQCSIDVGDFGQYDQLYIAFTWSADEVNLYVGPAHDDPDHDLRSTSANEWVGNVRRDRDGNLITIGGEGVEVSDYYFRVDGEEKLRPTASETFDSTIEKVEQVVEIAADQEFYSESILCQQAIVMLVTGLETYLQERFVELGVRIEDDKIISALTANSQYSDAEIIDMMGSNSSIATVARESSFNFQNIGEASDLYNAAFDIDLNQIINKTGNRGVIERNISYRHSIIHDALNTGILNYERLPKQDPVFANHDHLRKVIPAFVECVESIEELNSNIE